MLEARILNISIILVLKDVFNLAPNGYFDHGGVVVDGGSTPVKIFFRLRLQNLFPGVDPPSVEKGKWFAVVLCCACLRVEGMVSMSARCSKGNDYGFKCQLMF
jgi:hypothetical protein